MELLHDLGRLALASLAFNISLVACAVVVWASFRALRWTLPVLGGVGALTAGWISGHADLGVVVALLILCAGVVLNDKLAAHGLPH